MNNHRVEQLAVSVYEACDIRRVPINCSAVLEHYGLRAINIDTLKDAQPGLSDLCLAFSDDAFLYRDSKLIFYRDHHPCRTRFSLMRELGHYLLGHCFGSPDEDREANYFASYILAPRPYIPFLGRPDIHLLCSSFGISRQAARVVQNDLYHWWLTRRRLESWEEQLLYRLVGEDYRDTVDSTTWACRQWVAERSLAEPRARSPRKH